MGLTVSSYLLFQNEALLVFCRIEWNEDFAQDLVGYRDPAINILSIF